MKRNLMAILLVAALISSLVLLGCSDQGQPTEGSRQSDEEFLAKLDEVTKGNVALRAELDEVAEENAALRLELDELKNQGPAQNTQPVRPVATPTPVAMTVPAGPGICGRTPAVQQWIIAELGILSCQRITKDELYRITRFQNRFGIDMSNVYATTLRAGDFDGLVNLAELSISTMGVEAGALAGLDNLKRMSLSINSCDKADANCPLDLEEQIEVGAFTGLPRLEHLSITASGGSRPVSLPVIDSLPSLRSLTVEGDLAAQVMLQGSSESIFRNLPALISLEVDEPRFEHGDGEDPIVFRVGKPFFNGLTSLEQLHLGGGGYSRHEIALAPDTFDTTPRLREVVINSMGLRVHRDTFRHLDDLEVLRMSDYGHSEAVISLSEESPLFTLIVYGNEYPQGFSLVEEATNDR